MARQDYQGAPISGVTGNVAGSTTSDSGSDFISGGDSDRNYTPAVRDPGGNITNPYPDGFFSRIFGAENVSYAGILDQNQMSNIENMRYNRYSNPQMAVSKGFGSLFGGAEGEMTAAGPRVAQIQPATTSQSLAGILSMGLGIPGVGALSRASRTTYAPEGFLDEGSVSPSALSAASEIATGISPEAVGNMYDQAVGYVDQAREGIRSFFSDNDVDTVVNNISPAPAGYEEVVGGANGAPLVLNPSSSRPEIGEFNNINRPDDMAEMSYDDILRGRDLMADQITPFSPSRYDNLTKEEAEYYLSQKMGSQ